MRPRGGHLSPPTSFEHEVIPFRSNTETIYLEPSCILTGLITWQLPLSYPYLRVPPHSISLDPRLIVRRAANRMNRSVHPYSIDLSERYRPILPSLQEEESTEVVTNSHGQRRSLRIKRQRRNYARHNDMVSVQTSEARSAGDLQIIPSEEWSSHPSHFASWQTNEPEIIITSDAQLQTEDSDMVDPLSFPLPSPSCSSQANDNEASASETHNHTTVYGHPSSYLTDRSTQVPDEPYSTRDDPINEARTAPEDETPGVRISNRVYRSTIPLPPFPEASLEFRQLANRLIKHARNNKTLNAKLLRCLDCGLLPTLPVTGQCGHTRCMKCIESHDTCPCGFEAPETLLVNTAVQYVLNKMLPIALSNRADVSAVGHTVLYEDRVTVEPAHAPVKEVDMINAQQLPRFRRSSATGRSQVQIPDITRRIPMAPPIQYEHARRLLSMGRLRAAAPHLARVAASGSTLARVARTLLSRILQVIYQDRDPRRITRELFRSVRLQAAASWLRPSDLECVLCYHTYTRPVTTPCGHTYCKTCIERAMDYRKICALCQRSLEGFDLSAVKETVFVVAALDSIDASNPQPPPDPDVIPIFVCTVAYPSIPCPLFIFDPRYWLMIRRVLESDSRKFGMVAYERDRTYSNYGTVLEVCDCVHLEDGRSFLSTVGVSRFRVIERDVRDGCDVARIQPLTDITPTEEIVIIDMRLMGSQILYKALMWLNNMNKSVRAEIETAFGQIPQLDQVEDDWWTTPDGPAWLWWLIAILPLRSEIKVLILSTKSLVKRMMAVGRTLEAIDQAAITTTATSECEIRSALTNAAEWLERGS